MKNLVIVLVLLFSTLSFSQKVVTKKDFPVQISVSESGYVEMSIPKNAEVFVYKNVKTLVIVRKIRNNIFPLIEDGFPLEKGKYIIKVIKDGKSYKSKFSI